jgi:hypothetical protein
MKKIRGKIIKPIVKIKDKYFELIDRKSDPKVGDLIVHEISSDLRLVGLVERVTRARVEHDKIVTCRTISIYSECSSDDFSPKYFSATADKVKVLFNKYHVEVK